MIFGISYISYLTAIMLISASVWIILFIGFLTGLKSPVDISMYFRVMFKGFEKSELRIGWRSLIFGIEYIIGLIVAGFIKSAWYPAQWFRAFIKFILFGERLKKREELEKLKD